jgi:hypothetical protein
MKLNNSRRLRTAIHGAPAEPGRKMVWEAINAVLLRSLTAASANRHLTARVIVTNFEPCTLERINIVQARTEIVEVKSGF